MATRKAKYVPLDYNSPDTYISAGVALVQASRALDVAAQLAVESDDVKSLLSVAAGWMQVSEALTEPEDDERGPEDDEDERPGLGFR